MGQNNSPPASPRFSQRTGDFSIIYKKNQATKGKLESIYILINNITYL